MKEMVDMDKVTIEVPEGVDSDVAQRIASEALQALAVISDVQITLSRQRLAPGPGLLAQTALREERWRQVEETWGMLSAAEVAALTGNKPENAREVTSNLRRRKGLTGVKRHGALRYPTFQFVENGDGSHVVAPAWTELKDLLAPAAWADADLLAWAAAPNAWLEGRSPAQEINARPEKVSAELAKAVEEALPEQSAIEVA